MSGSTECRDDHSGPDMAELGLVLAAAVWKKVGTGNGASSNRETMSALAGRRR